MSPERAEQSGDERVVVIGSGPCGAAAADQLVARGVDVVMLDAGTDTPRGMVVRAAGNTVLRVVDRSHASTARHVNGGTNEVMWMSSLSHGGLSNYWTAAVPRFAPSDFTEGGRLDERYVWPVRYEDLVPYYERVEKGLTVTAGDEISGVPPNRTRYHHRLPSDWQEVVDAAGRNGEGMGAIPMAKGSPWMAVLRPTEFNSYHCLVRPMLTSPNFELRSGARATRLVWSPASGRVESVEYVDQQSGRTTTVRARAVVLAAGTIDTTTLLLRSTSTDFPDGIGNTTGLLGRYLHDHPREWWTMHTDRTMRALAHPIYLARADHDRSPPLMGTSHTIGLAKPAQRLRTYVRADADSFGVQVFGTMVPLPTDRVEIDRSSRDDEIRPRISMRYDQQAVANIEAARARLCDVLAQAGLAARVPGPFHPLLPGSSVHMAGTARMHHDPTMGVVDAWNRVHQAPDVLVCDMSAFTTSPEKNPTLTAMALAARAADRLADEVA